MVSRSPRLRSVLAMFLSTAAAASGCLAAVPPAADASGQNAHAAPQSGSLSPSHPAFITETDEPPAWTDCLWAAAVMYLDAASGGTFRPDRVALRAASGDLTGGSDFADLARGVEAIGGGLLRSSPAGGDPLTWPELRSRLAAGGSALLAGSYSALPAELSR